MLSITDSFGINFPVVASGLILLLGGLFLIALLEMRLLQSVRVTVGSFIAISIVAILGIVINGPFGTKTDEVVYHEQALRVAQFLSGALPADSLKLDEGKTGWPLMLGGLYFIGGVAPWLGILLSCLFVSLTVVAVAGAVQTIGGPVPTRLYVLLAFCPSIVVLGPSLLREAASWSGLAVAALGTALLMADKRILGFAFVAAGVCFVGWVRFPLGLLAGLGLGLGFILSSLRHRLGTPATIVAGLGAGLVLILSASRFLVWSGTSTEGLSVSRQYLAEGVTTGFGGQTDAESAFSAASLSAGLPRVLLGPYPNEFAVNGAWLWVLINAIYWWVLIGLLFVHLRRFSVPPASLVLLIASVVILVGLGVSLTNYGIVVRLRTTVVILLLPVAIAHSQSRKPGTLIGGLSQ